IELYRQGATALDRGDPRAAVTLFDRAIAALERAGVKKGLAAIHAHAAAALASEGDLREASARLERAGAAVVIDPAAELVVAVFAMAVNVIGGSIAPALAKSLLERATRAEVSTPELSLATGVLEQALARRPAPAAEREGVAFCFGMDARSMTPPRGERVDLVRYGPVRRLLERLVVARLEEPGTALSAEALIEAGWPGERMRHSAGLLRVYSAVRRLRRLGLEPILITRDDGYLLDPNAPIRRDEEA
ncbi:MAG: Signal transduction response regulator / Tetratricopeptide repeat-containing protein, partial [Labilithrix sp.]|nr:Signal transduction response regulator / Tetratricopeptide repeat-containing protein [Labilithrix sp.]